MTSVLDMDAARLEQYYELVDARTDVEKLSDLMLLKEARIHRIMEIPDRRKLRELVARAWVGMPIDSRWAR